MASLQHLSSKTKPYKTPKICTFKLTFISLLHFNSQCEIFHTLKDTHCNSKSWHDFGYKIESWSDTKKQLPRKLDSSGKFRDEREVSYWGQSSKSLRQLALCHISNLLPPMDKQLNQISSVLIHTKWRTPSAGRYMLGRTGSNVRGKRASKTHTCLSS